MGLKNKHDIVHLEVKREWVGEQLVIRILCTCTKSLKKFIETSIIE